MSKESRGNQPSTLEVDDLRRKTFLRVCAKAGIGKKFAGVILPNSKLKLVVFQRVRTTAARNNITENEHVWIFILFLINAHLPTC